MYKQLSRPQYEALIEIMELEFVLIELNLYLDTHPDCEEALRIYNDLAMKYHGMIMDYQHEYGMIHSLSVNRTEPGEWNWIDSPWPWEIEYKKL